MRAFFCIGITFFLFQSLFSQTSDELDKEVSHTFYITSHLGDVSFQDAKGMLEAINTASKKDENATLLLLGNVVDKNGFPSKEEKQESAKAYLKPLMQVWDDFNGNVILTPGKNEWLTDAPQSIDDLESYLQDNSKAKFWPNDGCPLEREDINDEVVLEMVDSQWFLEDWDEHPYINEKCEYKTRSEFWAEFKDDLKDSQGKTVIVAVYQPVMSNSKISAIDKMGGFTSQSYQNAQNRQLRGRMETLASQFEDVIFVSGKDRNLQYLEDDGIPQIISGAIGKTEKARARKEEHFESDKQGYAKLTVFKNGSSKVDFFEIENEDAKPKFTQQIKRDRLYEDEISYADKNIGSSVKASIYTKEETEKGGFYKWLWGDHYRSIYSKKIEAPVLQIDRLPHNVRPISEGGGNQSRSLRLIDDNENEYTLRALRKSALRFLQTNAITTHYVIDYLDNTVAERYVLDFYTTAHPYAPFAMNELSETLEVLHANPEIYYVPKQRGLGIFNEDYGDALFMLEEHAGDENKNFETFGKPDDILSTHDLRFKLRESKDAFVDEASFIRARLFDMLVGNWDRHQDQWRWAEFETEDGRKRYEAIPRDWDQAFPKYDGPIISLLKFSFPRLRRMESYDVDVKSEKWFNLSGYPMDKTFIKLATWEDWKVQVDFIQQQLTDEEIEKAFVSLPQEAQDESIDTIKKYLKARRDGLATIAQSYYDYLKRFEVVIGTEEDDGFLIARKPNGETHITITQDSVVFENSYYADQTKEIWVYGLDGNDTFEVTGDGNKPINIKVIGGKKNDTYDFKSVKKVKLYDYESKDNTIVNPKSRKWLTDSYSVNTYDYLKRKYHENILYPSGGYDGDTGFRIGLKDRFTTYGLANNPFQAQHTLGAEYYFATNGFSVDYNGEFANVFHEWNLGLDLRYTSPNFTMNYFGAGNNSPYDTSLDRDYNRVRIRQWQISPYLLHGSGGSQLYLRPGLESYDVSNDDDRYVGQVFASDNDVYEPQLYASAEAGYSYKNMNDPAFPNRAMNFDMAIGYKSNISGQDNHFGYVKPSLSLIYPLHPSGIAVIATKVAGETVLGDNYEFYHGALLGGNKSLRAYRNERFNGKSAFYQSTDLRVGVSRFRTDFVPLQIGVSAGFDYGRVWLADDGSSKWKNNFGGSVWVTGFSAFTGNLGLYHGDEGSRLLFSFGFNF
ncbi:metallophosphatase [Euzebyella marina]|uniref:Metallophosphatase n=1 Tax=Euzebyella marina TaxID=1761453 RepID=A0A3G2L260_9FLAO|nr:BamA/TamA family outer membrane protein [Euzebyella marina]AYN66338.1 metallophosphatase [Euzebyella marina]